MNLLACILLVPETRLSKSSLSLTKSIILKSFNLDSASIKIFCISYELIDFSFLKYFAENINFLDVSFIILLSLHEGILIF